MHAVRRFAVPFLFIIGCGASGQALGDSPAIARCTTEAIPFAKGQPETREVTAVLGGFETSLAELHAWRDTRFGPQGPREIPLRVGIDPSARVTTCYLAGDFPGYPHAKVPNPPPYTRMIVVLGPGAQKQVDYVSPSDVKVVRPGLNQLIK